MAGSTAWSWDLELCVRIAASKSCLPSLKEKNGAFLMKYRVLGTAHGADKRDLEIQSYLKLPTETPPSSLRPASGSPRWKRRLGPCLTVCSIQQPDQNLQGLSSRVCLRINLSLKRGHLSARFDRPPQPVQEKPVTTVQETCPARQELVQMKRTRFQETFRELFSH